MHVNILKQVRAKLQAVTEEKDKVATMLEEHTVLVKELQGTNIHVLSKYVFCCRVTKSSWLRKISINSHLVYSKFRVYIWSF